MTFGFVQCSMAGFGAVELTDIAAALASVFALLALLWPWCPRSNADGASEEDVEPDPRIGGVATARADTRTAVVGAFATCAIIIGIFSIASIPQSAEALEQITHEFSWPGLNVLSADGEPSTLAKVEPDWLASGGTVLLVAGLITVVLGLCWREEAARAYGATSHELRTAAVTVTAVPAIACARNLSGQPVSRGLMLAGRWAVLRAIAAAGLVRHCGDRSDTSSKSLFGALRVSAAEGSGLSPVLTAGSNTSGDVLGKMINPQNRAVGAVGLAGSELSRASWRSPRSS